MYLNHQITKLISRFFFSVPSMNDFSQFTQKNEPEKEKATEFRSSMGSWQRVTN